MTATRRCCRSARPPKRGEGGPARDRLQPLDAGSVLPTPTPATHPHPALNWEALCCLLIVRRCPRFGYRCAVATRKSSAFPPGSGGSDRASYLASRLRRHPTGPRSHRWPAGMVERDRLGRGRGPRCCRRGSPAVPRAPRRPRHRRGRGPNDGALRRLPHRTRVPADQRPPIRGGAGVGLHRPAGPPRAQDPGPRRPGDPRPLGDDPRRAPGRVAAGLVASPDSCRVRPVLAPPAFPASTGSQGPCGP